MAAPRWLKKNCKRCCKLVLIVIVIFIIAAAFYIHRALEESKCTDDISKSILQNLVSFGQTFLTLPYICV